METISHAKRNDFEAKMKLPRDNIYWIYREQIKRCSKKHHKDYKYYGAKGIRVEYSFSDFFKWWKKEYKSKKYKKPSAGRIDHNKNYSFNNIEMQEFDFNRSEASFRKRKPVLVKFSTGRKLVFKSINHAASFLKIDLRFLSNICNKKSKHPKSVKWKASLI